MSEPIPWKMIVGMGVLMAAFGSPYVYFQYTYARTHADVVAYNGFDEAIRVSVAGKEVLLPPHRHHTWADLPTQPIPIESHTEDGHLLESTVAELGGRGLDTVVYNVASRGILHLHWEMSGQGELLPPQSVHFVDAVHFFDERRSARSWNPLVVTAVELGGDAKAQPSCSWRRRCEAVDTGWHKLGLFGESPSS